MPCKQPDLERAAHSRNSALSQSLFSAVEFVRICSANMIPAQSTYCEIAERAELASFVHFCIWFAVLLAFHYGMYSWWSWISRLRLVSSVQLISVYPFAFIAFSPHVWICMEIGNLVHCRCHTSRMSCRSAPPVAFVGHAMGGQMSAKCKRILRESQWMWKHLWCDKELWYTVTMVRSGAGIIDWGNIAASTLVAASPPSRGLFPLLARRCSTWNGVRRGAEALATATWLSASQSAQNNEPDSHQCCNVVLFLLHPESQFAVHLPSNRCQIYV